MYPIGLLFGLGFDTATEVGLLGISATQAAQGLPIWSIMVFPALFTAGMTLRRHGRQRPHARRLWLGFRQAAAQALLQPDDHRDLDRRRLAGRRARGAEPVGDQLGLTDSGGFWGAIGALNDNFGTLGYLIVGMFAAAWIVSAAVYRFGGYDHL